MACASILIEISYFNYEVNFTAFIHCRQTESTKAVVCHEKSDLRSFIFIFSLHSECITLYIP